MFRNRGSTPNINIPNNSDGSKNSGYSAPHYSNYWNYRFFIIYYDKTFLAIELIVNLIIFLTAFLLYLFMYKPSIQDPLVNIKNNFLNAQLISIGITIVITILATILSKNRESLIKNLIIISILSILVILAFLGYKANMDNKYNEIAFEKFYEEYEAKNNTNKSNQKMSLGITGIKILDRKQAYISESENSYRQFSIKSMLFIGIYALIVVTIFYLTYRLFAIEKKRKRLEKDDIVVYDEEQNIKI